MKNKPNPKRNIFLLVLTALIWGTAFVAQREGGSITGPYTFICLRNIIGGIVLIPVIMINDRTVFYGDFKPKNKAEKKELLLGGICCGLCLSVASILQQLGIYFGTSAGKAGFLTACYIVLVPILGLFLKKKCGLNVWIAVGITLIGLYLLCIKGSFQMQTSDIMVLSCSFVFAMHILTIDYFIYKNVDPVRMSSLQFFFSALVAAFPMFFIEMQGNPKNILPAVISAFSGKALISILYTGIMSSGVAYTLQIIGQKGVNPTVASLLMSLESVFSVLAGWIILGELLSVKEVFGCVLIFSAVVLSQLPGKSVVRDT